MIDFDARVGALNLAPPDYSAISYPGARYGAIRPYRIVGNLLYLSGQVPEESDGSPLHVGRLGDGLSLEQGYQAARCAAINALGAMRFALQTLNRVTAIVRSENYVACVPEFQDVHHVASGATDLFREVFGDEVGVGCRATVGVAALAADLCFETVLTIQIRDAL